MTQNPMQAAVALFHQANGVLPPEKLADWTEDQKLLAVKLIREETKELEVALAKCDTVEAYDAILDILYVTLRVAYLLKLDVDPGFAEVQRSNMSKLGADGKPIISRGEELDGFPVGKILKGPNYVKPDLRRVIIENFVEEYAA